MSARVSPTDRIHARIDALFAQDRPLPEVLEEVARLGAQLLMQAALEAEVTEFLGRERYQRAAIITDARPGSRNGYRPVTVKTTAGPVQLERPKLRGTTAAFASRLFGKHVTKTNALDVACQRDGTTVLPAGRDHLGACVSLTGAPRWCQDRRAR